MGKAMTTKTTLLRGLSLAALTSLVAACGTVGKPLDAGGTVTAHPAALTGDYSGKNFSGTAVPVPDDWDIPGVPESNGKRPVWTALDNEQFLHIDGRCQESLAAHLPSWALTYAREMGWGALAVAVGEAGFAAAFPGADLVRYFLAGLGYGGIVYANNTRIQLNAAEKGIQGYCVTLKTFRAQQDYPGMVMDGWDVIPWNGPGHVSLPKVPRDADKAPAFHRPVMGDGTKELPPPFFQN